MSSLLETIGDYFAIYRSTAIRAYHQMSPQQYLTVLIVVATIGFFWMGSKRRA